MNVFETIRHQLTEGDYADVAHSATAHADSISQHIYISGGNPGNHLDTGNADAADAHGKAHLAHKRAALHSAMIGLNNKADYHNLMAKQHKEMQDHHHDDDN